MTKLELETEKLPPLERALFELIVARWRLGHSLWTIETDRHTTRALNSLASKGLIWTMHGTTPNTLRAGISELAAAVVGAATRYTPPILGGPQ